MTRRPRTFDTGDLEGAAPPEPAAGQIRSPRTSRAARAPRAPRALEIDETFEAIDAEAAQRATLDFADELEGPLVAPEPRRGISALGVATAALGALASLAVGLAVDDLIRGLAERADWLGYLGLVLTAVLAVALGVMAVREALGFMRLARIESLRERAAQAYEKDEAKLARSVVGEVEALFADRPATAAGRRRLDQTKGEIVDGRDLLALAETDLLGPLDREARALVLGAAKRVSIVTAVSPRALIDVAFVLAQNLRLVRQIAQVYGGRPGRLSFWRLARRVLSHLAVTGSIAVGDGLVQQVVGHGLASRVSARFGEGVVNGLLTARVGLAAMDVCRPLPFQAVERPGMAAFMETLANPSGAAPR